MTSVDRINGLTGNLGIKAPVRCATTANITLSGTQTIDGVAVVADDRVLVKNQTTASENGIYACSATAWSREPDFDGNRDIVKGTLIIVNEGSVNASTLYKVTASDPIIIGTSNITFGAADISSAAFLSATSTTSVLIGTGAKTFTTQSGEGFTAGQFLLISSSANSANYMSGQVTSYSGTSLVMNIITTGGSGTYADWNISISGPAGATGATGPAGSVSDGDKGDITVTASGATWTIDNNAVTGAKIAMGSDAAGDMLYYNGTDYVRLPIGTGLQQLRTNAGATAPEWATASTTGSILQTVTSLLTTAASTTTAIPNDDTIPQSGEGAEFTTLAITPQSASSVLEITVQMTLAVAGSGEAVVAALFVDSTADALAVGGASPASGITETVSYVYRVASGSTSARTYKVRYGCGTATSVTVNGTGGARKYGGILQSGLIIKEIL